MEAGFDEVITPDALEFVAELQSEFGSRREELLEARGRRRARLAAGELLDFLPDTQEIRDGDWTVAPVPEDLQQRWVEITGPTDRKMTINALNSGADGFMADFEDANAPTWHNMIDGHRNLRDAIDGTITYHDSEGKDYELAENPATLLVRPRGWHLTERHLLVDSEPVSGSLFDFGLYVFHCARRLLAERHRAVLLSPEDGVAPRGAAVERRVRLRPGGARDPARDDQGDRADRDAAGRVRDGRDPVRAPRALGRAQRRPLGLHLLLDQVLPGPARDGPARPRRRDHDRAVHARLHRAAGGDLPPARGPRDGRHVGADPEPQGRPGGQREGARRGPQGQGARGLARATTARGSRIRIWCRSPARCSRPGLPAPRIRSAAGATT